MPDSLTPSLVHGGREYATAASVLKQLVQACPLC
jgi:hypothetical protein